MQIGVQESLPDLLCYTRGKDGSHRRLGLTLEGMYLFLEQIGFIEWKLPELWPEEWARRRGKVQDCGLAVRTMDSECECRECYRNIAIGEEAYCESDVRRPVELPSEVYHKDCIARKVLAANRYDYGATLGWRYLENYQRNQSRLHWLNAPTPELDRVCGYMNSSPGVKHMTGYDLVSFVQDWLEREELSEYSIAEVILTQPQFAHLRQHVGLATIFWSHVDIEPVIDHACGTLVRIREAASEYKAQLPSDQFWWVDYFSLRQGISGDFEIEAIIILIKDIGNVVCSLFYEHSFKLYLSRSFCLIEVFAAMDESVNLICYGRRNFRGVVEAQMSPECPRRWRGWWPEERVIGPINCASASTSNIRDKEIIDEYIKSKYGFDLLNAKIKEAVLRGSPCDLRHRAPEVCNCDLYFYSKPCRVHETSYCLDCMDNFDFIGINAINCKLHKSPLCKHCY